MTEATAMTLPDHFLNYGSIMLNLYFIFQLKSLQSHGEQAKYWKERFQMEEDAKKQQEAVIRKLRAKLRVYEQFHGHETLALHEEKA